MVWQDREACDDGNTENRDGCTAQCREAVCGDGIVRADLNPEDAGFEACDDGGVEVGDGCDASLPDRGVR